MTTMPDEYEDVFKSWNKARALGAPAYRARTRMVKAMLPRGDRRLLCLDAGCGTGEYVHEMLRRGHTVHCFDSSPYALSILKHRLCRKYADRLKVFTATFDTFQSDARYDFILCTEVLEHVPDDLASLRVIASYLADNGTALVTVPFDPKQWSHADEQMKHFRRYTVADLATLGKLTGLRLCKVCYNGFPVIRLYSALRHSMVGCSDALTAPDTPDRGGVIRHAVRGALTLVASLSLIDALFAHAPFGSGIAAIYTKPSKT